MASAAGASSRRANCQQKPRGTAAVEASGAGNAAEGETDAIYIEEVDCDDDECLDEAGSSWVMGVSVDTRNSACGVRGRGDLLLLDSVSDEQVCPEDWCDEVDLAFNGLGSLTLRDVQGREIKQPGKRRVSCRYVGVGGEWVKTESEFVVTQGVREPVHSAPARS